MKLAFLPSFLLVFAPIIPFSGSVGLSGHEWAIESECAKVESPHHSLGDCLHCSCGELAAFCERNDEVVKNRAREAHRQSRPRWRTDGE